MINDGEMLLFESALAFHGAVKASHKQYDVGERFGLRATVRIASLGTVGALG